MKFQFSKVNDYLSKHSDLALAAVVMLVLALIFVRLPIPINNFLIACNFAVSILILLVSLYITDPLKLASFPTILLMTTIFRLGLNIASTRLILSEGNAGAIIDGIAEMVMAGSEVIGFILFIIITLVNFIVVAKGAERVSEVGARFTLDAMPGKQMSIDADLRAGIINMEQAMERRSTLQREAQMYGAMDGAMKFVKGDAIAGIIITVINLIGGFIIGMMGLSGAPPMTAVEALHMYSKLSVGDAIGAQIPALMISLAAGVVVTRVGASDKGETNLGRDIVGQMTAYSKPYIIAAGIFMLMAIGMQQWAFLIVSIGFAAVAFFQTRGKTVATQELAEIPKEQVIKKAIEKHPDILPFIMPSPVSLEVGEAIIPWVDDSQDGGRFINELIPLLRHGLYYELGVNFPGIQVRGQNVDLEPESYVININEVPVAKGRIYRGCILVGEPLEQLSLFNIKGVETIHPVDGSIVTWIAEEHKETAVQAGFRMWDVSEYLILHLSYLLRKYAHEFLGLQEIQTLLNELEKSHPALIKELVPKVITVLQLSEIFQRLVQEEISIRDLKSIFSTLAQWAEVERNTLVLTEHIRGGLKRYITHRYAGHANTLAVYLLDPEIEDMVRNAIRSTEKGNYLALEPEYTQEIVEAVGKEIASHPFPPGARPPVILTTAEIRRYFRKIIELEFPQLAVLSYQELAENLRIQPIARIALLRQAA